MTDLDLAPLDLSPMSGADLRSLRDGLSVVLRRTVTQQDMASVLGITQPNYSKWESAEVVPQRIALAARLAVDALARAQEPPALTAPVLAALIEMYDGVVGAFQGDAGHDHFRDLTFIALGSNPALTAWRADHASTTDRTDG